MDFMKGEGKPILFFERSGGQVQLVSFADESWGIVRDGRTVCIWEHDELVDCLGTFIAMADRHGGRALGRMTRGGSRPAGDDVHPMNRAELN